MPKFNDLAIRWNDKKTSIPHLVKSGKVPVHGFPHHLPIGRWVAIVSLGNNIQLMFKASAIEGPKRVKLANGEIKENGYVIKADKRTIRQLKKTASAWSSGIEASTVLYNFEFWYQYTQFCRKLAQEAIVSMRELDRALWQYSKENQ
jgi:hypothetical protein